MKQPDERFLHRAEIVVASEPQVSDGDCGPFVQQLADPVHERGVLYARARGVGRRGYREELAHSGVVEAHLPPVRRRLGGEVAPVADEDARAQ